jgi:hypothetical protein
MNIFKKKQKKKNEQVAAELITKGGSSSSKPQLKQVENSSIHPKGESDDFEV